MSRARFGRKLEDAIAAFVTAQKGTYLSGVGIFAANTASTLHVPFCVVWGAINTPQGGPEEIGMYGPQRAVVKLRINEHKTGTLIGQWADELAEILTRRLRCGTVSANTTASANFLLILDIYGDTNVPVAGSRLVIGEANHVVSSVQEINPGVSYTVTLTATATLTAGASVRNDSSDARQDEFTQLSNAVNIGGAHHPATGLHVTRIAWVDESSDVDDDCRTYEITLQIDGQGSDEY